MLVGVRSSVEGLDVFRIHGDGRTGIFYNLIPLAKSIVAGSAVGVVDWIWFAKNGLAVEVDGLVVVFGSIGLVARSLQLSSIVVPFLSHVSMRFTEHRWTHLCRKAIDRGFIDLRELVLCFNRGYFWYGSWSLISVSPEQFPGCIPASSSFKVMPGFF